MMDEKTMRELFLAYWEELAGYAGEEFILSEAFEDYLDRLTEENVRWYPIRADDKQVGFFRIGWGIACHPDADWFIADMYVRPDYRRQGLATKAMGDYISKHTGRKYCLFIIDGNKGARAFWDKFFTQQGFIPIYLADVGAGDETCTQYGWQKIYRE